MTGGDGLPIRLGDPGLPGPELTRSDDHVGVRGAELPQSRYLVGLLQGQPERLAASSSPKSWNGVPGGDSGDFPRPVPVGREQHRAQHRAVIPVELATERGDELLGCACRILVAPGRHGGASPGQLLGAIFAEPHSWPPVHQPQSALNVAARLWRTPPSPSRTNVVTASQSGTREWPPRLTADGIMLSFSEKSAARPGRIETNTRSMKLSGMNQRLRMPVTGKSPSAWSRFSVHTGRRNRREASAMVTSLVLAPLPVCSSIAV